MQPRCSLRKTLRQQAIPMISGIQVRAKRPPSKTLGQPLFRDGAPTTQIIDKSTAYTVGIFS
jgi:hypothetical protein